MTTYRFPVIIEKDKDGYFAFCPDLQGCYTQAETYEEALKNIQDAISLHVEDRLKEGQEIPYSESISLTSLEIAV
ncbi:MAG: type II toxin-antitoxin system HicB family antitoxin [Pseudomonadota bacterium]